MISQRLVKDSQRLVKERRNMSVNKNYVVIEQIGTDVDKGRVDKKALKRFKRPAYGKYGKDINVTTRKGNENNESSNSGSIKNNP